MLISINNPVEASQLFILIFVVTVFLSMRRRKNSEAFSLYLSQELKGLAILAIVFSHIGYFLVTDHRFLFPLTIMAGVGVNLFLFLSGFGLSVSSLKKKASIWTYHWRRILKMLIPFWLSLLLFFLLDFYVLNISYSWSYIWQSVAGWFPQADLYQDLNSPLWYFSLILFYYLIFPIVFLRKLPWLSALLIYLVSYAVIQFEPRFLNDVLHLYRVHIIAFPLGMLVGSTFFSPNKFSNYLAKLYQEITKYNLPDKQEVKLLGPNKNFSLSHQLLIYLKVFGEISLVIALLIITAYTAYHSGIDAGPTTEQYISTITMGAIILLFLIKRVDISLFYIFGFYSYEIYLLHWPILYRYDLFFKSTPAWLAVTLYLILFLALSWLLRKLSKAIVQLVHL